MNELDSTVPAERTSDWRRTAGFGVMIGAGAVLAASILDNVTGVTGTPGTAGYVTAWSMFAVGGLLLLLGAYAVHVRYGDAYGWLGLAGTAVAALGFLSVTVGGVWSLVAPGPAGEATTAGGFAFGGILLAMLGSLVLAVALHRSGLAPRAALLLIAAPVVFVATFVVGETISTVVGADAMWILFLVTFCTGWIAVGDALRSRSESPVVEPARPVV